MNTIPLRHLVPVAALALGAVTPLHAGALEGCPEKRAPVTPHEVLASVGVAPDTFGVMLWRFHGAAGGGHLFGTVHLGPPFITRPPPQALLALRDSDVFASEVLMDAAAQARFTARARVPDGAAPPISEAALGAGLFERYLALAARRGIPPSLARRLTPWAAYLSIGRPPIPPGASLDESVQQAAERMGVAVAGLQSVDALMDALEGLPAEDQIAVLADTICQQQAMGTYYRHLLEVYSSGVPEAVAAFGRAGREQDPLMQRLEATMVIARNARFVERVLELLARGRVFVAVGASHLAGPDGMLQRLRDAGFTVEPGL